MEKYPLISVVVLFYNSSKYVQRCLECLFLSSYKNIQLICVDDGSSDGTDILLEKYSKSFDIKYLKNKKNMGVAFSRNRALKHCSGEYVMFVDSDDTFSPDMITKMYQALVNNKVDLAVCDANLVYIDGSKDDFRTSESMFLMDENLNGKMDVDELVVMKMSRVLWNKIFKKSVIDRFKIKFPNLLVGEDVAFVLKYLSCINKVFFIREKLYNYSRSKNSLTNTRFKAGIEAVDDCVKSLKDVLEFMDKYFIMKNREAFEISYANEMEYAVNLMNKLLSSNIEDKV